MTDDAERSDAASGSVKCEPAAWGVMRVGGGWRCIVDSEQQAESLRKGWDRAENWVHEAIPLYRSPTLTDAEREAVNNAAYLCGATAGLANEQANATAWATCAATLRVLLERMK